MGRTQAIDTLQSMLVRYKQSLAYWQNSKEDCPEAIAMMECDIAAIELALAELMATADLDMRT